MYIVLYKKMMLKTVAFFIFTACILQSSVNSQTLVFEKKLTDAKNAETKANVDFFEDSTILISLAGISGTEKIILKNEEIIFSSKQTVKKKSDTNLSSNYILQKDIEDISGVHFATVINDLIITEAVFDDMHNIAYIIETNKNTGISKTVYYFKPVEKEHLLTIIADANNLYFFTSIENTDKIMVYIKKPSIPIEIFEKTIDIASIFSTKKTKRFGDFFNPDTKDPFFFFDNKVPTPVLFSNAGNKMYHQNGCLIFTIDFADGKTCIITLHLQNLSHSITSIEAVENFNTKKITASSYLQDSILTKTIQYKNQLSISSYYITNHQLLYHFSSSSVGNKVMDMPFVKNGFIEKTGDLRNKYFETIMQKVAPATIFNTINDSISRVSIQWAYNPNKLDDEIGKIVLMSFAPIILMPLIASINMQSPTEHMKVENLVNIKTGQIVANNNYLLTLNKNDRAIIEWVKKYKGIRYDIKIYAHHLKTYISCVDRKENTYQLYAFN